tara:strand:+ start:13243 stop:14319 length:1077 start_codon:yes stop_codon:yes gene_type:complete
MKVIKVRNVHEALPRGMDALDAPTAAKATRVQPSRAGNTIEFMEPVTTVYTKPTERVLFWEERDANPFFHFYEGLWMLGGRSSVDEVVWFNKNMKSFSDDGSFFHGAYGRRWRQHFGFNKTDQLSIIIERLKKDPSDRRCVLSIWDTEVDLGGDSLDHPCNTQVYFKVREGQLNMTVCNRSNDMIWGAYGANAVHFSMLHEYMAGMIGVSVGVYTQISDSLHVYEEVYEKLKAKMPRLDAFDWPVKNPYESMVSPFPMVDLPQNEWDSELGLFLTYVQVLQNLRIDTDDVNKVLQMYDTKLIPSDSHFFGDVAVPMVHAWHLHKTQKMTKEAMDYIEKNCKATDWALACAEWLQRRIK